MRKLALAAAAAALLFSPLARAADLPVKAPALFPVVYPNASGFFFGVGASGLGGTAENAAGSGSIFGGSFSASVGYTGRLNSSWFWFAEQKIKASSINGATSTLTFNKPVLEFETRFAIGAPASIIAAWASTIGVGAAALPSVPALPAGWKIASINPYGFVSFHAADVSAQELASYGTSWLFSGGAGIGNLYRISNGLVLDLYGEWVHQSTGFLAGTPALGTVKFNDKYEVTASIKF